MKSLVENKPTQNYAFINALRGIAALLVALLHFYLNTQPYYGKSSWSQTLQPFFMGSFDIGKFAIGVFFLVSGFLIPYSLERSKSIPVFAIHRAFRLYPAYWFSIILFLGLNSLLAYEPKSSFSTIAANLTMLQGYLRHPDLIGAFWTLQIEMTFYFLCAFLFFCGVSRKSNYIASFCLLMAIIAAILAHFGLKVPTALFIALLLMYCADALRRKSSHIIQLWLATALSLVLICGLAYGEFAIRYILSYWAAMAIFFLAYRFQQFNWFQHSICLFFADISYSVYLLHDPIGIQLVKGLASQGCPAIISFAAGFASTIAAAWGVYKLIEQPAINLGRKFASHQKFSRQLG
jgi:peptidoglycan/LPS O-acetylase OafA/YrhL